MQPPNMHKIENFQNRREKKLKYIPDGPLINAHDGPFLVQNLK